MNLRLGDLAWRRHDFPTREVVVGRETWKAILKRTKKIDKPEEVTEGWMFGLHIQPADVPEGRFWPKEEVS